ncbi:MAG TPA: hypothetical protein DCG23_09620 [Deltaproteobacteria bacterium]|nr:hypothetical protein [Deltaproteobacteria bacterium]
MKNRKLKIVDIGHSKFNLERAGSILETTISQTQYEGEIRVIKVITGHGSGRLRSSIREWCVEQEGRFQAVVFGEDYHMFNKTAVDMRADGEIKQDSDFGRKNSATTYIWLW